MNCVPEIVSVWPFTEVCQPLTDRTCPGEKLAHPAESQTPLEGLEDRLKFVNDDKILIMVLGMPEPCQL